LSFLSYLISKDTQIRKLNTALELLQNEIAMGHSRPNLLRMLRFGKEDVDGCRRMVKSMEEYRKHNQYGIWMERSLQQLVPENGQLCDVVTTNPA
jgi:hypothetical protein